MHCLFLPQNINMEERSARVCVYEYEALFMQRRTKYQVGWSNYHSLCCVVWENTSSHANHTCCIAYVWFYAYICIFANQENIKIAISQLRGLNHKHKSWVCVCVCNFWAIRLAGCPHIYGTMVGGPNYGWRGSGSRVVNLGQGRPNRKWCHPGKLRGKPVSREDNSQSKIIFWSYHPTILELSPPQHWWYIAIPFGVVSPCHRHCLP